ncbi:hypothetical protein GCM10009841_25200 [Microlunatus panaciterrae]|uniref:ATP synthase protein I n=1 Tax=Microlunatus panaciterrae TaxID=400768 RepID=A0ABS2RGT5_9ACTN|nr:hypothetical protein [Microlunatus panaciterrae]MBM7797401.1 hypothetical protein [Microlunatus panaciterrae]
MAAAVACVIIFALVIGSPGLVSAALASAMVLFFYTVGQLVMVLFANAGARTLMLVSMVSYTARIVLLGVALWSYNSHREAWPTLVPMAIFVTTIVVVVGWLTVEVLVFSRLRIGIYDTEYVAPAGAGDAE